MTAYTDLAEVRDALREWGEDGSADLVERAMREVAVLHDRLQQCLEIQGQLVDTMAACGLVRRA